MRAFIGILLAIAIAVLPAQSRSMTMCACGSDNDLGTFVGSEELGSAAATAMIDSGHSCCQTISDDRAGNEPSHDERPGGMPCENDDCPESCCSTAKVSVAIARIKSDPFSSQLEALVAVEPSNTTASAHVLGLVRPPRPSISV